MDRGEPGHWRRGVIARPCSFLAAHARLGHAAWAAFGASGVLDENARALRIARALRGRCALLSKILSWVGRRAADRVDLSRGVRGVVLLHAGDIPGQAFSSAPRWPDPFERLPPPQRPRGGQALGGGAARAGGAPAGSRDR